MSTTRRRLTALIAAAFTIALVALTLGAVSAPSTSSVKAAVVNDDQMVTVDGQTVPMGRQLTAELVEQDSMFDWEITTAELAKEGLADGTYAVVVTIPEDFSASLTSLSSDNVTQGKITVKARPGATSDEQNAIDVVTRSAAAALSQQVSSTAVSSLAGGLTEMKSKLGDAADGADQLADGVSSAASGIGKLSDGTTQLADGVSSAASGIGKLSDGTTQLADGASSAATGLQQLSDGTGAMVSGIGTAATGAGALSDGVSALSAGLDKLKEGSAELVKETKDAPKGAKELAEGASTFIDGATQIAQLAQLLSGGMKPIYDLNAAQPTLTTDLGGLAVFLQTMKATCGAAPASAECAAMLDQLDAQTKVATAGATYVGTVDGTLSAVEGALPAGLTLPDVFTQAAKSQELIDNAPALDKGITASADGTTSLVGALGQLNDGIAASADGAKQLASGSEELATGLTTASTEGQQLVTGAQQAADGVDQLATGASDLATGTSTLNDGFGQLASGASDLADGTSTLNDGAGKLATGATDLADGLGQAVDSLPSYTDDQLKQMVTGITEPIATPTVTTGVSGTGAMALAALLWVAAFLLTLIFPVFVPHLVDSVRPSFRLAFAAWVAPGLWSAVVGAVGGLVLALWGDVSGANLTLLIALGALAGICFAAVNQGLATGMGLIGRIVAMAVLGVAVVASLGALAGTPVSMLAAMLPTGLAQTAFNSPVLDGASSAAGAVVGLVVWGLGAFALTTWATAKRRGKPRRAERLATAG